MDTTNYPSLGRLASINAQLGAHNERVASFTEEHLDNIERLFRAAAVCDWEAVLRLSEELANQLQDRADKAVVRSALKVCDALRRDPSGSKATRHLGALLCACREAKIRRELNS
jgi:hypothetical protein